MCLDLPARVIACQGTSATVEIDGRRIEVASFVVPELVAGDWVRVIAGVVVERIDAHAAEEISLALQEARATTHGGDSWNAA